MELTRGHIGTADKDESAHRRERAAIAAQACQTCRTRKTKCDEQRPKCGLCQRLRIDCEYKEPLPTKKDKTIVSILETLTRLENKFDNLSMAGRSLSSSNGSDMQHESPLAMSSVQSAKPSPFSQAKSVSSRQYISPALSNYDTHESNNTRKAVTIPHKVFMWPSIHLNLIAANIPTLGDDLEHIFSQGTSWFIKQDLLKSPRPLPEHVGLPSLIVSTPGQDTDCIPRVAFPTLDVALLVQYIDAYFNTFGQLFPILDRDSLEADVQKLLEFGYGYGDGESVRALLVFALGKLALDGVLDDPIATAGGHPSGLRGGSVHNPPGLEIFNEARRRFAFLSTQTNLLNVQNRILMAIYYEANARHLDFWHAIIGASMTCQVLIKCQVIEWNTHDGHLLKRAFWTCVLSEDLYHIDLDLPQSGISAFQDIVPLPFSRDEPTKIVPGRTGEQMHYQFHFLAMIALRRLINRINDEIHEASPDQFEAAEPNVPPPFRVIQEMVRQLETWRACLPLPLQWTDHDRFDFPVSNVDPTQSNGEPLFFADIITATPLAHNYNVDMLTGQLRTRFYQARFILYRPYIWKALHFPERLSDDETSCAGMALKSACLWPLSMAPPCHKKRLVPHLFSWTQNFLGILLIFRMVKTNKRLRQICDQFVDRREIEASTALMLDWIRDVKQVDGVAEWSWKVLAPLYSQPQ